MNAGTSEVDFLVQTMYPLAQAAYSVMGVPTPPLSLPAGFVSAGLIQANPPKAAAAMMAATPDQQRLAHQTVMESSIFGLLAINAASATAVIAIRGTSTLLEWLADIDAPLVANRSVPSSGLVHMGFQCVYEQIRDSILDLLGAYAQHVKTVHITGHSLGGALAILCGMDLTANSPIKITPQLHTFAGPRAGSPGFAANFDKAVPVCTRVVNFLDVVPQLPIPPLYKHVGVELSVHGGFRPLDVTYAHHLTTYLAGLQKLQADE